MNPVASNFGAIDESPRLTRPLERLAVQLTVFCNLKCKMCSVWEMRELGVPLPVAKQLLADAYRLGARTFVPFGAENFTRKDFIDIVEHAHELGYTFQAIVTNGTMISDQHLERLSRTTSIRLNISIDGPREIHDELRGAGNFDKSVATARECVRRKIAVSFSGVILRETLPHLSALIDLAQELDDLPDVGPERQRGPSAGRTVLEDHPRVVRHPQALVDEPLGQPGGTCSWCGIGALPQPGQQRRSEPDRDRGRHDYIVTVALHDRPNGR